MIKKRNLVFLGPPGAGKGTIAQMLAEHSNLLHISTGDIFRKEIKNETELGKKAKEYVTAGGLVPDALVAKMVGSRLAEDDCGNGFILDGFPRTLPQAELFKDVMKTTGITLDAVLYFEAGKELLIKRLTSRLTCKQCGTNFNTIFSPPKEKDICDRCGGELYQRADDSLDTVNSRLEIYNKETAPLIDYYKKAGLLLTVDGTKDRNSTFPDVLEVLS